MDDKCLKACFVLSSVAIGGMIIFHCFLKQRSHKYHCVRRSCDSEMYDYCLNAFKRRCLESEKEKEMYRKLLETCMGCKEHEKKKPKEDKDARSILDDCMRRFDAMSELCDKVEESYKAKTSERLSRETKKRYNAEQEAEALRSQIAEVTQAINELKESLRRKGREDAEGLLSELKQMESALRSHLDDTIHHLEKQKNLMDSTVVLSSLVDQYDSVISVIDKKAGEMREGMLSAADCEKLKSVVKDLCPTSGSNPAVRDVLPYERKFDPMVTTESQR